MMKKLPFVKEIIRAVKNLSPAHSNGPKECINGKDHLGMDINGQLTKFRN